MIQRLHRMLKIFIDKESPNPIYKQIIEQITLQIKNGSLKPGEKLPSERELAAQTGISRSTIKKAYEELERNKVIEVVQGSGSFVSKQQDVVEEGRKERAIKLIDELLTELENMKFSYREISIFIDLRIAEREEELKKIKIAAVDCNPEALSIYKKQLAYISRVEIYTFLLSDVISFKRSEDILENFDIILTTSTHYKELCELIPQLSDRIMRVVVSPSRQTIIDLATIPENARLCVLSTSKTFRDIIKEHLMGFNIRMENIFYLYEYEIEYLEEALQYSDILIVPPGFFAEKGSQCIEVLKTFRERGGKIINFEYQIERGSMIFVEERISNLLNKYK